MPVHASPFIPTSDSLAELDVPPRVISEPFSRLFIFCAVAYLVIYSLEAPIRYALFLFGKDQLIFVRDSLIILPLLALVSIQILQRRLHPVFLVAFILIGFHGLILMGTIGSFLGVVFGVKMLINILLGFFVAAALIWPSERTLKILFTIWLVTIVGVCLEKFLTTFPWTGVTTYIGNLSVDISRNWEIDDPVDRRVAGFARSSIAVAILLPPLTFILMNRIKHQHMRVAMAILAIGAVLLTTQKGAVIAFAPIALSLLLPAHLKLKALRFWCVAFILLAVLIPLVTSGVQMGYGSGVFSMQSLHLRIAYTWPEAWAWISHHQLPLLGVGLGGIGGPQRLYAPDSFNPSDNIFVLMYAYFGAFAIAYILFIGFLSMRSVTGSTERVATAVAIVAFTFGYGAVLSVLEDQSAPLFLGAALGGLWHETRQVRSRVPWGLAPHQRPLSPASTLYKS